MQTPPKKKIGQIGIKDAQSSETCEKNNFPIYIFWEMVDFVHKILIKLIKYLHK